MRKGMLVFLFTVFLAGCSQPELVSKEQLVEASKTWKEPKVVVWYYQGTDEKYHYFKYQDLGINKYYKVVKAEMVINEQFPYTNKLEKWQPMPWGPRASRSSGT